MIVYGRIYTPAPTSFSMSLPVSKIFWIYNRIINKRAKKKKAKTKIGIYTRRVSFFLDASVGVTSSSSLARAVPNFIFSSFSSVVVWLKFTRIFVFMGLVCMCVRVRVPMCQGKSALKDRNGNLVNAPQRTCAFHLFLCSFKRNTYTYRCAAAKKVS